MPKKKKKQNKETENVEAEPENKSTFKDFFKKVNIPKVPGVPNMKG